MAKIKLIDKLMLCFSDGIEYKDAIELCVALYCSSSWFDDVDADDISKDNIANVFSKLARYGGILNFNVHLQNSRGVMSSFYLKEHWVELISSSFKLNCFYDRDLVAKLVSKNKAATG